MNIGDQQRVIIVEPLTEDETPEVDVLTEPEGSTPQFTPQDWRRLGAEMNPGHAPD